MANPDPAKMSDHADLMDEEDCRPTPAKVDPLIEVPGYITEAMGRRREQTTED
jgi:hypothetical protein